MSIRDKIAVAMKNPKVLAGVGAGAVGLVLLARGGSKPSVAPSASADPNAALGMGAGGLVPSQGYDFTTGPIPTIDSTAEAGLQSRFNGLEDGLGLWAGELSTQIGGLSQVVADLQAQRVVQVPADPQAPTAVTPTLTAVTNPTPGGVTRSDMRWIPGAAKIGGATDIPGATFADRAKLSNGQYAPMVKYKNGTTVIHPSWQKWMASNKVTKA